MNLEEIGLGKDLLDMTLAQRAEAELQMHSPKTDSALHREN